MADDLQQPDEDGITAYHGSPHDFERFDMSKIGTGEGAQAYGHGLYFAQHEPIAKSYRDTLSVAKAINDLPGYTQGAAKLIQRKGDAGEQMFRQHYDDLGPEKVEQAIKDAKKTIANAPKGHMYEVHINAHHDHFLDWDKALWEQPESVRRLAGWSPEHEREYFNWQKKDTDSLLAALEGTGDHIPTRAPIRPHGSLPMSMKGADIYEHIKNKFGAADWPVDADAQTRSEYRKGAAHRASQHLLGHGIKGIKYLDASSRNETDQPTRNYVVFDDKLVNVKRKYAKGGAIGYAGGGNVEYQSTGDKVVNDGAINWGASDSPADFFRADKALQQLRPEMFQRTSPTTAAVATETRPAMPAPVANPPAIVAPAATERESVAQAVPLRQPTVQPSNDQRYGLFAVGTNDFKNPKVAYQNALNIIDNAAGSNIKPVFLLPNLNDPRFRDVSEAVRRAAEERGITYHVPEYDPNDPLHMTRKSAQSFAKQYPNAFLGGDSNIVRLANWGYGLPTSNKGNAYVDPQTGMMMGRVGAGSAEISNWLAKYRQSLQQRKRGGSIVDRALMLTSKKA